MIALSSFVRLHTRYTTQGFESLSAECAVDATEIVTDSASQFDMVLYNVGACIYDLHFSGSVKAWIEMGMKHAIRVNAVRDVVLDDCKTEEILPLLFPDFSTVSLPDSGTMNIALMHACVRACNKATGRPTWAPPSLRRCR